MKKLIISVLLAFLSLSLVGCRGASADEPVVDLPGSDDDPVITEPSIFDGAYVDNVYNNYLCGRDYSNVPVRINNTLYLDALSKKLKSKNQDFTVVIMRLDHNGNQVLYDSQLPLRLYPDGTLLYGQTMFGGTFLYDTAAGELRKQNAIPKKANLDKITDGKIYYSKDVDYGRDLYFDGELIIKKADTCGYYITADYVYYAKGQKDMTFIDLNSYNIKTQATDKITTVAATALVKKAEMIVIDQLLVSDDYIICYVEIDDSDSNITSHVLLFDIKSGNGDYTEINLPSRKSMYALNLYQNDLYLCTYSGLYKYDLVTKTMSQLSDIKGVENCFIFDDESVYFSADDEDLNVDKLPSDPYYKLYKINKDGSGLQIIES